ncbi:SAF domain-containing protein [Myceligenerans crystallogenes]|uniref:AFP-like domain-containing protein n=1 Tax=Myceligenerans crystallogenes TaxID=316335 RepID=A0ABP4ZD50_9MICO
MTATAPAPGARADRGNPPGPGHEQQIASPPKMRRRPAMIAASVACIAVGGLVSAWAWQTTSNTNSVLTVRQDVLRGEVVTRDDLVVVQAGADLAIKAVPGELLEEVAGKTAALDIAAGSVVTPGQLTDEPVPASDRSVVGVSLAAGLLPAGQVHNGDRVRVVVTEGGGEAGTTSGTAGSVEGIVRGIQSDEVTGNTLASVEVAADEAVRVASAAAAGKVALVLEHQVVPGDAAPEGGASPAPEGGASAAPEGEAARGDQAAGDGAGE